MTLSGSIVNHIWRRGSEPDEIVVVCEMEGGRSVTVSEAELKQP